MTLWGNLGNIYTWPYNTNPSRVYSEEHLALMAESNWGITIECPSVDTLQNPATVEEIMIPLITYVHDLEPTIPIAVQIEMVISNAHTCHNYNAACGVGLTCYGDYELPTFSEIDPTIQNIEVLAHQNDWGIGDDVQEKYYNITGYYPYWWWSTPVSEYHARLDEGMDVIADTGYVTSIGWEEGFDNGVQWATEYAHSHGMKTTQYWVYANVHEFSFDTGSAYKGQGLGTYWRNTTPDRLMMETYSTFQADYTFTFFTEFASDIADKPIGLTTQYCTEQFDPVGYPFWATTDWHLQKKYISYYFWLLNNTFQNQFGRSIDCVEKQYDAREQDISGLTIPDIVDFFTAFGANVPSTQIDLTNIANIAT